LNSQLLNKQERVLLALSNSGLVLVDKEFPVERRTVFGICGEDSDLAVSLEWHDSAGCQWVADFTKASLRNASVKNNQITLKDSEDEPVCMEFHNLQPGEL
jgi:hypothetical protein